MALYGGIYWSWNEQAVEQVINLPVIWDAITWFYFIHLCIHSSIYSLIIYSFIYYLSALRLSIIYLCVYLLFIIYLFIYLIYFFISSILIWQKTIDTLPLGGKGPLIIQSQYCDIRCPGDTGSQSTTDHDTDQRMLTWPQMILNGLQVTLYQRSINVILKELLLLAASEVSSLTTSDAASAENFIKNDISVAVFTGVVTATECCRVNSFYKSHWRLHQIRNRTRNVTG